MKNGPGNQETGSIKPLNPKDFCQGKNMEMVRIFI